MKFYEEGSSFRLHSRQLELWHVPVHYQIQALVYGTGIDPCTKEQAAPNMAGRRLPQSTPKNVEKLAPYVCLT